ncbi:two component transcriptional regulator [Caballeronia arvi]|uniref:Two component transcriptional regulator n=1 Tax=Caballeronia arvi TaxID=1777135 RepID=A0A158KXU8_9BURK|nr:two component transcriptional regulator [Caballeronia arvi]
MAIVLVVDDEPAISSSLSFLLHDVGHEVLTASNGAEALELAEQRNPAVVVSDWLMPVMGGAELRRAFARNSVLCSVPFIFMSGTAHSGETQGTAFLQKPFDVAELLEALAECLRNRAHADPYPR